MCLPLLLTMNLNLHIGRWWPIVCPSSGVFLNFQDVCIPRAVRILLPAKPILSGTPVLPVVHLLHGSLHMFYPYTVTRAKLLT